MHNLPAPRDIAVDIFELSQMPQFAALQELFSRVAGDYFADMPKKGEDVTAYQTSCYVSNTVRMIMVRLGTEIEVGARLSNNSGEPLNDTEGPNTTRRRC